MKTNLPGSILAFTCLLTASCSAALKQSEAVTPIAEPVPAIATVPISNFPPEILTGFIQKMAVRHKFDKAKLNALFQSVEMQQKIIDAMNRPAEAMPWHKYRKIFMTDARIDG